MKRTVLKIDEAGFFIEDVLIEVGQDVPEGCIETLCTPGFYRPKWDAAAKAWAEGLTPEEIAAIPASIDLEAALATDINAATTLTQLKAALLGKNGMAKVQAGKK